MEDLRPPEISPRLEVRICLSAFCDAHVILPSLTGRARLRRKELKLQWWEPGDDRVFDHNVRRIGEPVTDILIEILQMRLNVVLERMHIRHDNPFGLPEVETTS
ncbi:hypothetical protein [Rhodopirellula bahusiensis]|uniref:hypothetical protein n=2 Tax=Rhodopirellula bahusiensis TaxID=2014065 RepID=UPI003267D497